MPKHRLPAKLLNNAYLRALDCVACKWANNEESIADFLNMYDGFFFE